MGIFQQISLNFFVAVTILLSLAAAGCTSESESGSLANQQVEASRPLDKDGLPVSLPWGTYGWGKWDLSNSFPNAVWSGTLVIDESCVYLDVSHILDDSHQDGYSIAKDVALRSFMWFPAHLVRLDIATGELWAGEYGPMSSGDEVVVVGSGDSHQDWSSYSNDETEFFDFYPSVNGDDQKFGCFADTAFYVMSMQSSNSYSERPALDITRSQLIASLSWKFETEIDSVGMEVILDIEPPCVYGVPLTSSGELYPDFDRLVLELPRPILRFKADNNSLWNNYLLWLSGTGPVTTGDIVTVLGVDHPADSFPLTLELQEVGCSADGVLRAAAGYSTVPNRSFQYPNRYLQYSVLPTGT